MEPSTFAIRYTSLAACVTTAVVLVSNTSEAVLATPKAIVLPVLTSASLSVFYFALYRSETALVFPKGLRLAAGITAAALTVNTALSFSNVLLHRPPNWRVYALVYLFLLALVAVISLMGSIACAHGSGEISRVAIPKFLSITTTIATVAGAVSVLYTGIGMIAYARQVGPPQSISASASDLVRYLVFQICLFMPPLLVWLRIRRRYPA